MVGEYNTAFVRQCWEVEEESLGRAFQPTGGSVRFLLCLESQVLPGEDAQ